MALLDRLLGRGKSANVGKQLIADESDPMMVEIRRRFTYARDEWRDIHQEGRKDMRVVAGDSWDPKDKRQRIDAGRPALSLDEIGQYTNQLVNDVRQHKRAIQVTPVGDGANDKTAQFRQDLIRQIEYQSKAQDAYTCGFENAVNRSYGFWRVASRYATSRVVPGPDGKLSPQLLNQDLVIEPIVNPDQVLIDPDFQRPDGSDMRWAFEYERWPVEDYKRQWPNAVVRDASPELIRSYPAWFPNREQVQVAVYWAIDHETTLVYSVTAADGSVTVHEAASERDIPKGSDVRVREVETPRVKKRLTNGIEVLEERKWPGSMIPIVCNFGKILYVDEGDGPRRKILSLVRLARDPQMLYCYYRTCEAELVGMTPKFPYFVRRGSLKPKELDSLQKSLSEPIAVIQVENKTDQAGNVPEMPVRQPYEPPIQALEVGAESARRAIQAAMGAMPLPTQAQRDNEKSGVALDKIQDATQQGTYHFIDHFESAITRTGVILEDLIPHFYDTPRTVAVRDAQDKVTQQRINDVPAPDQPSIDVEEVDHDVTLSTGPAYQSERVAQDEFADSLLQELQTIAAVAGPKAAAKVLATSIKLRNIGPLGQVLADTIDPPDPSGNVPPQMLQAMQALQEENAQLKQAIATDTAKIAAKRDADIAVAQVKGQIDTAQTAATIDGATKRTMITAAASMSNAQAKVDAENFRSYADALEQRIAKDSDLRFHLAKVLAQHHLDQAAAATKTTHAVAAMALEHAHEHAMADKTHDQALESMAAGAAMQPPADETAPNGGQAAEPPAGS